MKIKTICFDIDNVICKTNKTRNYSKSVPIKKNIKVIICNLLIFIVTNFYEIEKNLF